MHSSAAWRAEASLWPASRPASTSEAAMRFRSHSKGARMVSSKSLMSKTRRPSGAAKAPRLRTWASPQIWVRMPVLGRHAQVGGHHRHGAAEVAEGRLGHELPLELDQRRHAAVRGALEEFERRPRALLGIQVAVILAADLLAPRLAQFAAFFHGCTLHGGNIHPHGGLRKTLPRPSPVSQIESARRLQGVRHLV